LGFRRVEVVQCYHHFGKSLKILTVGCAEGGAHVKRGVDSE